MPDASPLRRQGQERLFIIVGLTSSPLTEDEAANKEFCERENVNVSCRLFPSPPTMVYRLRHHKGFFGKC